MSIDTSGLIINYDKVITKEHSNLLKKLGKPPSIPKNSALAVLLSVHTSQLKKLNKLPPGTQRVEYLNSEDFVNSIQSHCYAAYDKKRKVCMLRGCITKHIVGILTAMLSKFPSDTLLWVSLPLKGSSFVKMLAIYAHAGFSNPHVSNETPLGKETDIVLAMSRLNSPEVKIDVKGTLNDALYTLQQFKKLTSKQTECSAVGSCGTCSVYAQLTNRTLAFLQRASKVGIQINGTKGAHNELTAELYAKTIIKKDNKFVYVIDIDEKTLEEGQEENVDVSPTRYNFHSHPHAAYVRHSVDKAWPSLTDYMGYLTLGNNTIFHCVATLEGIYAMSFGPYWVKNLKGIDKDFIHNNFNINHKEPMTPQQYVQKVNKILLKKHPIFYVQFFPWNKAHTVFQVSYARSGINCFATEEGKNVFRKLSLR